MLCICGNNNMVYHLNSNHTTSSSNLSRSESEKLLTQVGKDDKKPHKKENKLHALGKRAR